MVIPAYNEAGGIGNVLGEATAVLESLGVPHEIIVVDDCSKDETATIAEQTGVRVLRNVQNGGYGYSLMRGIRAARYPTVAIVDADGSYPIAMFPELFEEYTRGIAMVVGHRQGKHYVPSLSNRVLRWMFRSLAEFIVGRDVPDVNSGMRIFDRDAVLPLFPHMSYGFSFTTSITLLFMMRALPVSYVPVPYLKREGASKVNYFRDSIRALQIIVSITARLNPIKLFLLAAVVNVVIAAPLLLLMSFWGDVRTPMMIAIESSALLVGLGFVVEALIDKSAFRSHESMTGK
jgi:glycosyltransferase involved in cell wall biosynthesis